MISENSWQNKIEVKRGNIGEKLVKEYLEDKGYILYIPVTEGPHPFDQLVVSPNKDLFICEVKTKPARIKYPDTGVDIRSYNTYKNKSETYNLPVLLCFVDDFNGSMYGNWLHILDKPHGNYPLRYKGIIYWNLSSMKVFRTLNINECNEIKKYSTSNYI